MENKYDIAFIGSFPMNLYKLEGMAQRVDAVDNFFENDKRIYVNISFFHFIKKEEFIINDKCICVNLNLFYHLFRITSILNNSNVIYIHSIINFFRVFLAFFLIKKTSKIVLDAHGIVPEEAKFEGEKIKYYYYSFVEKILFKSVNTVICVTDTMVQFYKKKYPNSKVQYINFSIIPDHLLKDSKIEYIDTASITRIMYCGNLQKWQNIDLLISLIKKIESSKYEFFILTGEPGKMTDLLIQHRVNLDYVTVKSVPPEELYLYYSKCHYGFILRDDDPLNRVSCPTKLIEYLYYGLTPIVKLEQIGDFYNLGYQYVSYQDIESNLVPKKSDHNNQIIKKLISYNQTVDLRSKIFQSNG